MSDTLAMTNYPWKTAHEVGNGPKPVPMTCLKTINGTDRFGIDKITMYQVLDDTTHYILVHNTQSKTEVVRAEMRDKVVRAFIQCATYQDAVNFIENVREGVELDKNRFI
jgi:hypothetical protein